MIDRIELKKTWDLFVGVDGTVLVYQALRHFSIHRARFSGTPASGVWAARRRANAGFVAFFSRFSPLFRAVFCRIIPLE